MDYLNTLQKALGVKVLTWEKKLSLRNNVFYVETVSRENRKKPYIIKEYPDSPSCNEVFFLSVLRRYGLNVPEIVWHDARFIIMEYIQGTLLTDLLGEPLGEQKLWINELARWFAGLHAFMQTPGQVCLGKSDLNLRNFIFDGRVFYGVDFEEVCFSPPERDLGGICAFILNNHPMFEKWKYQVCCSLIGAYETISAKSCFPALDREAVWYYLVEELKAAAARREKQRDYLNVKIKELTTGRKDSTGLRNFLAGF
ncbi:MAG: Phosphotransferase enzyme family protein [Firmicutes bacterium ADurb.Bin456]|nr:MAG: Phosphotransferase enzyme family protein [Firmicutes bacterium ADurb.Bin456]